MNARPPVTWSIAAVQVALVMVAVLATVCWPPERGRMLLVPLSPAAARTLVTGLDAAGGRIVALGPLRGSVIAFAAAPGLRGAMLERGVLPLAGVGGCGAFDGDAE